MSNLTSSFVDRHDTREAFLGNRLARLVDQIIEQGEALLREREIGFHSPAASTMILLNEREGISTADIARELHQPHQLAAQRVSALLELGLVERKPDAQDARRNVLALTRNGRKEARLLQAALHDSAQAFEEIYRETGVQLSQAAEAFSASLAKTSLGARIAQLGTDGGHMGVGHGLGRKKVNGQKK